MKVELSPRQRYELAVLFCGKDLKLADLTEMKAFNRARLALRLNPITALITQGLPVLAKTVYNDSPNSFDLETAGATFILAKIVPLIAENSYLAMLFVDFLEGAESGGMATNAPALEASTNASTSASTPAEDWSGPSTPPEMKYEDLRTFLGFKDDTSRADVLAKAEALCAPPA